MALFKGKRRNVRPCCSYHLRGDESRTLTLCREYLEGVEGVKEVNLSELHLEPYYGDSAAYRAQLEAKGLFDDPMFDIGKDFAEADEIVIGAPYWDLSFPAALKIYIEHAVPLSPLGQRLTLPQKRQIFRLLFCAGAPRTPFEACEGVWCYGRVDSLAEGGAEWAASPTWRCSKGEGGTS